MFSIAERERCTAEADDDSDYCTEHNPIAPQNNARRPRQVRDFLVSSVGTLGMWLHFRRRLEACRRAEAFGVMPLSRVALFHGKEDEMEQSARTTDFENVKAQVGYCGIWCGSCVVGNGALSGLTRRYRELIDALGVLECEAKPATAS